MSDAGSPHSGPIEWTIRPYEGAGAIDFNMTQAEVEAIIGPPLKPGLMAWYEGLQVGIEYRRNTATYDTATLEFIWFHTPPAGVAPVIGVVSGVRLYGAFEPVVHVLRDQGFAVTLANDIEPGASVCLPLLGVLLYEDDGLIEDTKAFSEGYVERLQAFLSGSGQ